MGNPEIPILFEPLHAFRRLHPPSVLYVPFIKKSRSMTDTTILAPALLHGGSASVSTRLHYTSIPSLNIHYLITEMQSLYSSQWMCV